MLRSGAKARDDSVRSSGWPLGLLWDLAKAKHHAVMLHEVAEP